VVFALPRELAPLVLQNRKAVYDLLFRGSAEILMEVAQCDGPMKVIERFTAAEMQLRSPPVVTQAA